MRRESKQFYFKLFLFPALRSILKNAMRAVLLAAGQGLRLRPLTLTKPKAIVPLANRPSIVRLLEYLRPYEIKEMYINLHYLPEDIKDVVGAGTWWNTRVHYSYEPELLGTAGAIKKLDKFIGDDKFIVVNTDIATDIDLIEPLEFHETRGAEVTLIMTRARPGSGYEHIGVSPGGRILINKDPNDVVENGIYTGMAIFEPTVLDIIPQEPSSLLNSVFIPLAEEGGLYAYFQDGYWSDIGTVERYLQVNKDLINGKVKSTIDGRLVGENIWISETSEIDLTVRIEEPALIGRGVSIERGALIGPNTVIGNGCYIGPNVKISNSVVWDGCRIGSSSLIDSCVIADGQQIVPGQRLKRTVVQGGIAEPVFNI
ncbi:MAG: NDP-sugar synthase [Firmicutes bacterium]|nr:NDP-sugar synthase [Bacillota bacterium]